MIPEFIWRRMAAALLAAMSFAVIPTAAAQPAKVPLEAYGELPGIEDTVISPSGNRVASLLTINGKRMILVLGSENKPLASFHVGDLKVRSFDFVTEDLIMMQRSSTQELGYGFAQDKFEAYQAILLPIDGSESQVVFANRRDLPNLIFGYHGTRLVGARPTAFFGALELKRSSDPSKGFVFDHGRPALYAVDLLTNEATRVDRPAREDDTRDWLVGSDGEVLARLDRSRSSGKWEITSKGQSIASGKSPAGGTYLVSAGEDGSTIIFGSRDDDGSESKWYEVPVDGSAQPKEVFAEVDIDRIFTDSQTGHLTGFLEGGGEIVPVFFDEEMTSKVRKVRAAFKQLSNRMVDWTRDFDHIIVRTSGNGDSGSYFRVDLAQSKADAIGYERMAIGPENVGPISTLDYTASDGLEMDGILTLPPGREAKSLPLIMLPHGGPHSQDREEFDWWAQAFASRGYAVFQPNFRGSTNRGGAFVRAGYGEWGGKMQSDISDGLAMLADKGIVDPKRACIVGASYGGYAALSGVTLQNGLYRCAVSVAGVSDLNLMSRVEYRESGGSKVQRRSLEQQLGPRSRYKDISPRHQAGRADAPILLIHGRDDTVVHYDQSVKMADALKDAGKPYEFVELEGEDHWLSLSKTRQAMLAAAVAFVEKHNPAN